MSFYLTRSSFLHLSQVITWCQISFLPLVTENTKACIHVHAHAHVGNQLRNWETNINKRKINNIFITLESYH